jgi:excinuclease ABC subunit A
MASSNLVIKGARQNNLKGFDLEIPHDRVIAVTGVSGSGKSSLAFETIFAEGQWRFIESLSSYARLFLEKLDRPDVDEIRNIRPAIALEQRNPVRGSRSTVGTLTELNDLFRLLYAKVGRPHCPGCGSEVHTWNPSAIVEHLIEEHEGERAVILFRVEQAPEELVRRGFQRIWLGDRPVDFTAPEAAGAKPPFLVVLDRLVIRAEARLADSVETAFSEGHGAMRVIVMHEDGRRTEIGFSKYHVCEACEIELPEPTPLLFSFNHPVGACPACKGFGNILHYDESLIVPDPSLTLAEGVIEPWQKPAALWWQNQLEKSAHKAGISLDTPWHDLPEEHRRMIHEGSEHFYGIDDFFDELEGKRYKLHVRVFLARYRSGVECPECHGKRLSPGALAYKVSGRDIADLSSLSIGGLHEAFLDLGLAPFERDVAREVTGQISAKVGFLKRVGLDYLTLSRESRTLSGGEYQRVNLSNQLASRLTGTLYVLDEPTVGLHQRDTERISAIMAELAEAGNTVIVVEHDRRVIEASDWVVELGPGGGRTGGNIVYNGPLSEFRSAETATGRYLRSPERYTLRDEEPDSYWIVLKGATGHNLKNATLEVPLGSMTVVTGVSGSGKSTLVVQTLCRALMRELKLGVGPAPLPYRSLEGESGIEALKLIDQAPIGRSPRSNPVTYLKIFDALRKLFADQPEARMRGLSPGFFSFNVPGGRCETCRGEGFQRLEMYFFEDLYIKCEDCGGTRYTSEALGITYQGKTIHDVLNLTVDEAAALFSNQPAVASKLNLLREIGLGYLRLGQPATTLSGGEAQRLKLCAELGNMKAQGETLYVLDEPTVGLHAGDVDNLLKVLRMLVDAGNTVLIIEHNLDVAASADWLVDLGPEGGDGGGQIVYAGPPRGILRSRKSITAQYLRNQPKAQ